MSEVEKARLDRDEAIVRTLSGDAGQLAVFVLSRLNAQADALVAWTRSIAELKRSKFVLILDAKSADVLGSVTARRAGPQQPIGHGGHEIVVAFRKRGNLVEKRILTAAGFVRLAGGTRSQ